MEEKRKGVDEAVRNLAEAIREYSRSQKELWKQVRRLALEANGRGFFSLAYESACLYGCWEIPMGAGENKSAVYVDLETGELNNPLAFFWEGKKVPAADKFVIQMAAEGNLDLLAAEKTLERLRKEITGPDGCENMSAKQVRKRRNGIKRQCRLKKIFAGKR